MRHSPVQWAQSSNQVPAKRADLPRSTGTIVNLLIVIAAGVAAGEGLWRVWGTRPRTSLAPAAVADEVVQTEEESPPILTVANSAAAEPAAPAIAKTTITDAAADQLDMSATSWLNPFDPGFWTSEGWEFDAEGMRCSHEQPGTATFRRPYHKLRLEAVLQPIGEVGPLKLMLHCAETDSTTVIRFDSGIEAAEVSAGQQRTIKQSRRKIEIEPNQACNLQVAATGNRIQVAINGRRKLVCNQPAAQSGHEVTITLAADGSAWQITRLRIEGE